MARRKRILCPSTKTEALEVLREARPEMNRVHAETPYDSSTYRQAGEVNRAIDGMAEERTGDREFFWMKPH